MTLTSIALLALASIAVGTVNIQVSVAHKALVRPNGGGAAVVMNSPIKFQTRREGRVLIVVPD
jgi:hypothetical protein